MNDQKTSPETEPERDLHQRACSGDADALEALLEPCWPALYRIAYRVTGSADDANDLAQEAVLRILQKLPQFRGECAFSTWAYRVGLNVCLTARRKRREIASDMDTLPVRDPSPGPEAAAISSELRERACEEIERLRPAYREAVLLRLNGELSYEEIAGILRVSVNTVRLRVSRGMSRLRSRLKPWLDGEVRP